MSSTIQQGNVSINSGENTVAVVFPTPYASAPDVIVVMVENTSSDPVKLSITAKVTQKDGTGFIAALSQVTNTANYVLNWLVLSVEAAEEFLTDILRGRKVSELNASSALAASDYFLFVQSSPIASTKRVFWSTIVQQLQAVLSGLQTGIVDEPTPNSPGSPGEMRAVGGRVYFCVAPNTWQRTSSLELSW